MSFTFEVCIDESGDDGFAFNKNGCAEWFLLSALVYRRADHPQVAQTVREIKETLNWKLRKPLHFKDVKDEKREYVIQRISQSATHCRAITVVVYKPLLDPPESFQERHRLYFYFTRFLLERVSWLCKYSRSYSDRSLGNGTARVIFSNRADLSYDEMAKYFTSLRQMETSIDWDVIRPNQFETLTNGRHEGLQLADSIASGFYCADHQCVRRKSERWAEVLKPLMYRSKKGQYRGYGLKLFPESKITQGELAPWVNRIYPS